LDRWQRVLHRDMNMDDPKSQEACGNISMPSPIHPAKPEGPKAIDDDVRNRDPGRGGQDGVATDYLLPASEPSSGKLSATEQTSLLELARRVLIQVVADTHSPPVAPTTEDLPARFLENKACFVTLTKDGVLHGCIGHLEPREPLYLAVMDNTRSAALNDPRFSPIRPEEVSQVHIEISVLTEPQALVFSSPEDLLHKLQPRRDGVVLRLGSHRATFLPQVWEQLPDKTEFLDRLSQKAGCEAAAWRGNDVTVSIYQVECFEEP